MKGRFIVVEGLEGAGKSTAIKIIENFLAPRVPELILTREPGGTTIGESIRRIIKEGENLDPRAELLLLYAARVQLVEEQIQPALNRGAWVLADRFELSTFAYQGWGRELDFEVISQLSTLCLQGFKPDLIFYLDIHPEVGLSRVVLRGEKDRIEQESLDFFNRVHQGYYQLIQTMDNVINIDASQSMEGVQTSILTELNYFIENHANI